MATKAEGIWACTVLGGRAGKREGVPFVQIDVQIDDGPSKGMRGAYEDEINTKSFPYVERSCVAVGWKGGSWTALESDIADWIKNTGGKTTVEVQHIEIKRGKAFDKWVAGGMKGEKPIWDKIKGLGRGAARQLEPLDGDALKDADQLLRDMRGSAPEDAPPAGDDIPFITSARVSMGEVSL